MEVFGRYRLLQRIAVGGMGEIFLARSTSLDGYEKDLVLKRILPVHSASEHFVSMFLDEARISMSLSHENIVQVFDFGETDGRYYIAMEHVHGCDLRTLLRLPGIAGQGIPHGLALYIMREAMKGLDYAHNRRGRKGQPLHVVHRDISPDNILLSLHGGVKITDFGIAKARGQLTELQPGAILGKVHYMSPEVADGKGADARSDLFSSGGVLWELLVGSRMYEQGQQSNTEFYERIRDGRVDPPSKHNRDVPRRIEKVVMHALAFRPEDRFDSAREMGDELQDLLTTKYRGSDSYLLQGYLGGLKRELKIVGFEDLEDTVAIKPHLEEQPMSAKASDPAFTPIPETLPSERTIVYGEVPAAVLPEVKTLAKAFEESPSVWSFVEMGDACASAPQATSAISCYRLAAVKFAQHGLLAQSLLCAKLMLEQRSTNELLQEIARLPTLVGRTNEAILPYLFRTGGELEEMLAELIASTFAKKRGPADPPLLLVHLGPEGFAQLAKLAPLRRYSPEDRIVVQGEKGETMYLVLSGRVLVHVAKKSGDRVNVASLQPGDFFGENSFFSGAPRNATVEAVEKTALIEIDPALYDRVMSGNPKASSVLTRFYKERIVDRILATAPTFGLLPPSERREILGKLKLRMFAKGTELMRRGASAEHVYLVKRGSARVMMDASGSAMILGPGAVLGEHPVVTGGPSAISASAGDEFEAFVLKGADLNQVLARQPERREAWLKAAPAQGRR
jgi:serine/threonine protein kinase/CRP-like cAMP-binding protein